MKKQNVLFGQNNNDSVIGEDEFQIPKLILCRTPNGEEMERRRKISMLRKQYGIRIEETEIAY